MVNVAGVTDPVAYRHVHFSLIKNHMMLIPCTNHTSVMKGSE
jgi:hypothetical protein